jgi:hypothetical protein
MSAPERKSGLPIAPLIETHPAVATPILFS